jgi:hypothetical protein
MVLFGDVLESEWWCCLIGHKKGLRKRVSVKKLSARKRGSFVSKKPSDFDVVMTPEEESTEDILAELDEAFEGGVCPQCGGVLESFSDKGKNGLRCLNPKCLWSVCSFGVFRF